MTWNIMKLNYILLGVILCISIGYSIQLEDDEDTFNIEETFNHLNLGDDEDYEDLDLVTTKVAILDDLDSVVIQQPDNQNLPSGDDNLQLDSANQNDTLDLLGNMVQPIPTRVPTTTRLEQILQVTTPKPDPSTQKERKSTRPARNKGPNKNSGKNPSNNNNNSTKKQNKNQNKNPTKNQTRVPSKNRTKTSKKVPTKSPVITLTPFEPSTHEPESTTEAADEEYELIEPKSRPEQQLKVVPLESVGKEFDIHQMFQTLVPKLRVDENSITHKESVATPTTTQKPKTSQESFINTKSREFPENEIYAETKAELMNKLEVYLKSEAARGMSKDEMKQFVVRAMKGFQREQELRSQLEQANPEEAGQKIVDPFERLRKRSLDDDFNVPTFSNSLNISNIVPIPIRTQYLVKIRKDSPLKVYRKVSKNPELPNPTQIEFNHSKSESQPPIYHQSAPGIVHLETIQIIRPGITENQEFLYEFKINSPSLNITKTQIIQTIRNYLNKIKFTKNISQKEPEIEKQSNFNWTHVRELEKCQNVICNETNLIKRTVNITFEDFESGLFMINRSVVNIDYNRPNAVNSRYRYQVTIIGGPVTEKLQKKIQSFIDQSIRGKVAEKVFENVDGYQIRLKLVNSVAYQNYIFADSSLPESVPVIGTESVYVNLTKATVQVRIRESYIQKRSLIKKEIQEHALLIQVEGEHPLNQTQLEQYLLKYAENSSEQKFKHGNKTKIEVQPTKPVQINSSKAIQVAELPQPTKSVQIDPKKVKFVKQEVTNLIYDARIGPVDDDDNWAARFAAFKWSDGDYSVDVEVTGPELDPFYVRLILLEFLKRTEQNYYRIGQSLVKLRLVGFVVSKENQQ